jgi:hypothetical protein
MFSSAFKNKIIFNFVRFVATKKSLTTYFFHPCLLLLSLDPGSEIRDPEWVKIRIRGKHPGSATLDPDPGIPKASGSGSTTLENTFVQSL